MKYADFNTATNGFPLESDASLGFMQADYQSAVLGLSRMVASDVAIVSGMAESGTSVAAGWILLNNELIEFMAGTKQATYIIVDTWVTKANQDGTLYPRYRTRKAQFGTGAVQYNYADLKRSETIFNLKERLLDLISLENEVVLKGCAVTNINPGASTCDIAAGQAVINRKFVTVGSYAGAYPVYLKEDGTFTNTLPGTPYIKFDPHTSQRLPDVMRRVSTMLGSVAMQAAVVADRFDGTGLGKWEWKGFALANGQNGTVNLQGRFPVGRYLGGNAGDPIWDSNYATLGSTGGEKQHTLTIPEMPEHNHTGNTAPPGGFIDPGEWGLIKRSAAGQSVTADSFDAIGSGNEPNISAIQEDIPYQGGSDPHENRPPWLVLAFIQRI